VEFVVRSEQFLDSIFAARRTCSIEAPMDPRSLTRWRQRIREEGVETLLMITIEAVRRGSVVQKASALCVIVDTTMMPKAIAHSTDGRLFE